MKRLFFSVLALTLSAFVFWSCDKEDEIDNGKGKPAERGSFMTVQQQRDAFQDNLTGIVGAILYVWMLIQLWKSTSKNIKPYLAVIIVSMFFASNFFTNGMFVLQYIVILSYLDMFNVKKVAV